jgi:hypothetical protein
MVFTACAGTQPSHATAANTAEKTVLAAPAAAPTKDALVTLEKSAYEAWKSKDTKFWDAFLADKFVGYGSFGKLDKASATKEYSGADCEIKSYALSNEQMKLLVRQAGDAQTGDNQAALITYTVTIDGACGGQKVPANSAAASVFVREGGTWKAIFHAQAAVVDPKAQLAQPADEKEAPGREVNPSASDAGTDAMLAIEKNVWEAWRVHDGTRIERLTAKDISFINIFGTYFATKADALKDWTGTGCDVKSVSVTNATGTMLSPTAGILTFTGTADGMCYGAKVNSVIWGTSIYVKDGDAWKWTFGINVPARR